MPDQVHERLRLSQKHRLIRNEGPRCQSPALPISNIHAQARSDSINRQETQVMWRELILDTGIAQPNNQFHADWFV